MPNAQLQDLLADDEEEEEVEQVEALGFASPSVSPAALKTPVVPAPQGASSPILVSSGEDDDVYIPTLLPRVREARLRDRGTATKLDKVKGRTTDGNRSRAARSESTPWDDDAASDVESQSPSPYAAPRRPSALAIKRPPEARRSSRLRLVVEVPVKPLSVLKRYALHSSVHDHPTLASRRNLLDDDVDSSYASSSSSVILRRPAQKTGPKWRTSSSRGDTALEGSDADMVGSLSPEGEDEDGSESDLSEGEEEDSDGVMLRRSKRRRGANGYHRPKSSPRQTRAGARNDQRSTTMRRSGRQRSRRKGDPDGSTPGGSDDAEVEGEEELDELEDENELESSNRSGDSEADSRAGKLLRTDDVLKQHRQTCEKCQREPASQMLEKAQRLKKRPGQRRKKDDDAISDEELATSLDGWLECKKCVISSHWGCLSSQQQREVLNDLAMEEGPPREGEKRRRRIEIDESYHFTCSRCSLSPACLVCHKEELDVGLDVANGNSTPDRDSVKTENGEQRPKAKPNKRKAPLLFRCLRCKQACHYEHLRDPYETDEDHDLNDIAEYYQKGQNRNERWLCHQCHEWIWSVDIICAWRPLPANAKEPPREPGEKPNLKDPLPREYLVKWTGRGFRHATWVPHPWLMVTSAAKLRNFLDKGPALDLITDETLAARGDDMAQPTIANVMEESDDISRPGKYDKAAKDEWIGHGPAPDVEAENSIPQEWRTVDRVLDVYLIPPQTEKGKKGKRTGKQTDGVTSSRNGSEPPRPARPDGIEPPEDEKVPIDDWEDKTGRELTEDDVDEIAPLITWCFVKWDDLQYDQSCWDTPPPVDSSLYPAYKRALKRYLSARKVVIPVLNRKEIAQRELDAQKTRTPPTSQPDCIVGGKLMPFQLEGFQWLLFKHFQRESCILADDMGLGKTIQIASLLGYLGSEGVDIYPMLVIVPNSTITNWVREFEKWVPHMRVVPYYGDKASRKIISKYEVYHKGMQNKAEGLKAHVLLTTYDIITGPDFRVFSGISRWEVLCVDEGQRLKSDSNLIFNRLKTLNSVHRILLTGTPLNNNLRELFNLLNFLDPEHFAELEDLGERFANLNEGLIGELHDLIRPYILRRIKADVLKLPPKIEIIVPISLTPLQKNVYKTILEKNGDILKAIAEARRKKAKRPVISGGGAVIVKKRKTGEQVPPAEPDDTVPIVDTETAESAAGSSSAGDASG